MAVLLQTPLGDIVVDLYVDDECAPVAANFMKLCQAKYYNSCLFYNVQPRCLAQTGDPTSTGRGGASASSICDGGSSKFMEWQPAAKRRPHDRFGLLSMVSMGKVPGGAGERHKYGSQFFFTLRDDELEHLDAGGHTVIGEIAEGTDVLRAINALYLDDTGRPWEDVRILHTHALDDPFDDPPGLQVPPESPTASRPPTEAVPARVQYGGQLEEDDGLTPEEREEKMAEKKARSQAEVLEMVGDLPHADVEVPKNELFICKLNKVTEDSDLEVIFSRFGRINSCDIVRDWKTGDSLNFAFVSFEEEPAAVEAYKKMNNVLIDDSRIRVDFSQSVAKIWSRYTMQYKGSANKQNKINGANGKGPAPDSTGHYGPKPGDAPLYAPQRALAPPQSRRPPQRRDDDRKPSRARDQSSRRDEPDRDRRDRRDRDSDRDRRDDRRDDRDRRDRRSRSRERDRRR
ncbi:cyclophilin-like domain-containing protein [Pelagophyceae sp. CCMP2097]|nr:cyclophilin-like domain-containing protein [Pelagophyceae sp. CCMP2097]